MQPSKSDIDYILQSEKNWSRFQRFATDLLNKALNLHLVSNELRNDLGRDAQWFKPGTADIDGVVCAAIRTTVPAATAKFRQDFNRLRETGLPNHILMASTVTIEEADESAFRQWCRQFTTKQLRIEVFGRSRLAEMAANHLEVFLEHYSGDLLSLRHRLLSADDSIHNGLNGLRVALATQFNPDGTILRNNLIDACVGVSLSKTKDWMSLQQLCAEVGHHLHLPNAVIPDFIRASVERLVTAGHVTWVEPDVRIESAGLHHLRELESISADGARNVRDGFSREVLRRLDPEVGEAVANRLPEIWVRLQELVADAFWSRSLDVCNRVLELCDRPLLPAVFGVEGFTPFVSELFGKSLETESVEKLTVAVVDAVLDPAGAIRAALLDTVAKFVGLCSIGIHPEAYEEVNVRLRKWLMLLDTHVLLSWLCEGEPDHQSVCALLESWKKLKREVAVPQPVIEETAYHAWISNDEAKELRGDNSKAQSCKGYVAKTAFLRTFLFREGGLFSARRWQSFIRTFIGSDKTNGTSIRDELESRSIVVRQCDSQSPPPQVHGVHQLRPTVRLSPSGEVETELKPVWDSQLIEIAMECKRQQEALGGGVIILSKSAKLHAIMESRLPRDRISVRSSASVGFAIAMLPGSSISFVHLRELLFDDQPFLALRDDMRQLAAKMVRDNYAEGLDQLGRKQLCEDLAERVRRAFGRRESTRSTNTQ